MSESNRLPVHNAFFWGGLTIYAVSFFLVAVNDSVPAGQAIRGFSCAYLAFLSWFSPSNMEPGHAFEYMRIAYICVMTSGLINPLFFLYIVNPMPAIRRALLSIIPSCWVVFYYEGFIPREGHILWVLGMLLVLYSDRLGPQPFAATVGE
jgi:hypothetical protein